MRALRSAVDVSIRSSLGRPDQPFDRAWSAGDALCPGRAVQADGGGRGQVQALCPSVERYPDGVVGGLQYVGGQAVGLAAEQPSRWAAERAVVDQLIERR